MCTVFRFSNKKLRMTYHLIDEVEVREEYDQTHFLSLGCQDAYSSQLARKKLFPERGILLDQVLKTLLEFYE